MPKDERPAIGLSFAFRGFALPIREGIVRSVMNCSRLAWFLRLALLLGAALVPAGGALAHDPNTYGGLFRSRDMGASWIGADVGLFLNGTLALAVDPRDPNHLLLGTDNGLFGSPSGGRSWMQEAPGRLNGAVFAVAFAPAGGVALCGTPAGLFRWAGGEWTAADAPSAAAPARAIAYGAASGRVYLLGPSGLFASDDGGARFERLAAPVDQLAAPAAGLSDLAVVRSPKEVVLLLAGGRLMASEDGGRHWQARPAPGALGAIALDPAHPARLWAAEGAGILRSDDLGRSWQPLPGALPVAAPVVRGIAADAAAATLVVTSDRGLFRSVDGGQTWQLGEGGLPVRLESGPLARDPASAATLYAVFSLIPYAEAWRSAIEGKALLARADLLDLVGAGALVLALLLLGAGLVFALLRLRGGRGPTGRPHAGGHQAAALRR